MRLPGYRLRLMTAMFLLSVALIAYQLAVIQLLSYVQWYHYANMVISIALLGFGAAGTTLSLNRERLLKHSETLLPLLMIFCGFTMVLAVEMSHSSFARFDSYLLFTDRFQWVKLLVNSLLYFIPFFIGALALGIVFIKYVQDIGRLYFANLAGSGIGAVLSAVLAWYFLPASLSLIVGTLPLITAFILIKSSRHWYILLLSLPVVAFIVYRTVKPFTIELSQYKSLSKTMNLPSARIGIQHPGPYGLVQLVSADALRYAPGLSLAFDKVVPIRPVLFNNGDWYGPVDSWNANDSFHLLDYTTMAVPYVLKKRDRVLVLNAANGLHVSQALGHGALQVDVVEAHEGVYRLLMHELAGINDSMMYRPEVSIHATEPRSFLSATNKKYDLIQLPMSGSFGGGVGLYALREEYGLTKEAFLKMWSLLNDDGVISITAWVDYPFRNSLKITATLAEVLDEAGIKDHVSHIIAVRSWGTVSFIAKKSPITEMDTLKIRKFCNDYFFDPLWLPGLNTEERTVYNTVSDSSFFAYADELLSGDREKLYGEYGFHIQPATDDQPYFSQYLRWKSLPYLAGIFGSQTVPFVELGWLIATVSFLQISVLAILLILIPLFKIGLQKGYKRWTLFYFGGLGAGYMLLEIVLIQKFVLYFGNPVYAASFVICAMMLASGAGSYYSTRISPARVTMQLVLLMIFLVLLFYTFFLSPLLNSIARYTEVIKLLISLPLVALPAILMGLPFPLGIRALTANAEKNIPWAWGINGCVSVISASLAALLAVEAGFSIVTLVSAIFYAVSMLSVFFFKS